MNSFITPLRAAPRAAIPALGLAVGLAALLGACPAGAFTPSSKRGGEAMPLNLAPSAGGSQTSSGGASVVRTIIGLLIVIAVIWGLTWILKQVKTGRETRSAGSGLTSLATLALGSGRTLHLVRAGRDYLLVGSAEHGVAHIHRYTEEQARDAGLLDLSEPPSGDDKGLGPSRLGGTASRLLQIPGQARASGVSSAVSQALERLREWTVRR